MDGCSMDEWMLRRHTYIHTHTHTCAHTHARALARSGFRVWGAPREDPGVASGGAWWWCIGGGVVLVLVCEQLWYGVVRRCGGVVVW